MNILWLYNMPMVPEAGGTERISWLISRGLEARGHKPLGMLVMREGSEEMTWNGERVDDLGAFLREHRVEAVVNQIAYATWLLRDFLERGGREWHEAGGKIISCLHFDSKPQSSLYYFHSLVHKTLNDRRMELQSWLLYPLYARKLNRKYGDIYRYVHDNSDWLVTLSDTHHPYIRRVARLGEDARLTTINNPLTFDGVAAPESLEKKEKVVLVCARMDEYQKKLSRALKAWRIVERDPRSEGWRLEMVGTGPDLVFYKELADRLGLRRVSFEGRHDPEPYYRRASLFLMTSGFEGWGLTLTESLQCGTVPVVMDTAPVFGDIIERDVTGELTPARIRPFARRVLELMGDQARLRRMQQSALASAPRFLPGPALDKWERLLGGGKKKDTGKH